MDKLEKTGSFRRFELTMDRRIQACACIFAADKAEKMMEIANGLDISVMDAAYRYTIGCLKNARRRGTARNYAEALEQLEADQIGDRKASVKTPNVKMQKEIARINAINGTGGSGKKHARNMARIIGTLYVQYEERAEGSTVEAIYNASEREKAALRIEDNIKRYMRDYVSHLSPTAQRSLHAVLSSHYSTDDILTTREGEAEKLRNKIAYIHRGFPHADAINIREFTELCRKYVA